MKRSHFLILLSLFLSIQAFANTLATIKGRVLDATTQTPLAGATLHISDLKLSVSTNANGEFTFNNLPAKGKFLLEVRYLGYKTSSKLIDLSSQQEIVFFIRTIGN